MFLRTRILSCAYRWFPFPLEGDACLDSATGAPVLSCVINFYGRIDLLQGILYSLLEQDLSRDRFEVVLAEDGGGSREGRDVAERFSSALNVHYSALPDHYGMIGYAKNFGLSRTVGKYVLFLDDDTVILQKDFLSRLLAAFEETNADGIIPHGNASWYLRKGRYGYHEPYFPTNRCVAYRRDVLLQLRGFVSDMIGQEDVEFVIRFMAAGRSYHRAADLEYYHPPLIIPNFRKPMAVGISFYKLKERYSAPVWWLMVMNSARHIPLFALPTRKHRNMSRFGIGFMLGIFAGLLNRRVAYR